MGTRRSVFREFLDLLVEFLRYPLVIVGLVAVVGVVVAIGVLSPTPEERAERRSATTESMCQTLVAHELAGAPPPGEDYDLDRERELKERMRALDIDEDESPQHAAIAEHVDGLTRYRSEEELDVLISEAEHRSPRRGPLVTPAWATACDEVVPGVGAVEAWETGRENMDARLGR